MGKPRPALIVQSDLLVGPPSLLICSFTSQASEDMRAAPSIRAVARNRLGRRLGFPLMQEMAGGENALLLLFGFAR